MVSEPPNAGKHPQCLVPHRERLGQARCTALPCSSRFAAAFQLSPFGWANFQRRRMDSLSLRERVGVRLVPHFQNGACSDAPYGIKRWRRRWWLIPANQASPRHAGRLWETTRAKRNRTFARCGFLLRGFSQSAQGSGGGVRVTTMMLFAEGKGPWHWRC